MCVTRLTFSNFTYAQLSETDGCKKKVEKVLRERFDNAKLAYFQINYIDEETGQVYIFAVDNMMKSYYFFLKDQKFSMRISDKLSTIILLANLDSEKDNFLNKLFELEENPMSPDSLYSQAVKELSLQMEYLFLPPALKTEEEPSVHQYGVNLMSFTNEELIKMAAPIVSNLFDTRFQFRIYNRTINKLDIIVITSDPIEMYQVTVAVENKRFSAYWNRYINCIPYGMKPSELKKEIATATENIHIRNAEADKKGVLSVLNNLTDDNGEKIEIDPMNFAKFLFSATCMRDAAERSKKKFKDFKTFFKNISSSEIEAQNNLVSLYIKVKTFEQKEIEEFEKGKLTQ